MIRETQACWQQQSQRNKAHLSYTMVELPTPDVVGYIGGNPQACHSPQVPKPVSSASGSHAAFLVGREGTAVARGGHHMRGDRSLPLTLPLPRANPDRRAFRDADGDGKAEDVIASDGEGDPEAPFGYKRAAGVFKAREEKQGHQDKDHGEGEGDPNENQNTAADGSDPSITALASVGALALVCFGWCWLSTMMVWLSFCVCKRRGGQERDDDSYDMKKEGDGDDDAIRATVCGTLASVVCVSDGTDADGDARPASQPCTPRSRSARKPNPDKTAGGEGDGGNIVTPFVFRRILKAVVDTTPPSHGGSECCNTESAVEAYSERGGCELPQLAGNPLWDEEEEEQKRSDVENTDVSGGRGAGGGGGEAEVESSVHAERSITSRMFSSFRGSNRGDGAARQASTDAGGLETTASSSVIAGVGRAEEIRARERTRQREVRSRVHAVWNRIRSRGERGVGPPLTSTRRAAEATERREGESREGLGALACATAPSSNRTMVSSSFHSTGGATGCAGKPKGDGGASFRRNVVDMKGKAAPSHGDGVALSSPDIPRAKMLWRAFSEVDHARVEENHRRATQRHLAVFNMVPAVENPRMCYAPFDA